MSETMTAPVDPGYGYPIASANEDTLELSFQKLIFIFKNHWILITALTLVFAILGFLYSQFLVTPKYQASVNMIVQTNSAEFSGQNVSNDYVNSAKNLAKTYSHILNSSRVQNAVIKELGLDYTAEELGKMAVAEPLTDSQVVRVTVITEDAKESRAIAKTYLKLGPQELNDLVEAGKCNAVSGVEMKQDPIKPGMKRTVALAALRGFALAFAIALFRQLRHSFFVTPDDIKNMLGLPVLGVIPYEPFA